MGSLALIPTRTRTEPCCGDPLLAALLYWNDIPSSELDSKNKSFNAAIDTFKY
jgi:hypothetical protein